MKIFWDLDETLIHAKPLYHGEKCDVYMDNGSWSSGDSYKIFIRPNIHKSLEFSRNLVGSENVFILTAASERYAIAINDFADFGFENNQIYDRTHIGDKVKKSKFPHKKYNVLIDNLMYSMNEGKVDLLNLKQHQYLSVSDYSGHHYDDSNFERDVEQFLFSNLEISKEWEEHGYNLIDGFYERL